MHLYTRYSFSLCRLMHIVQLTALLFSQHVISLTMWLMLRWHRSPIVIMEISLLAPHIFLDHHNYTCEYYFMQIYQLFRMISNMHSLIHCSLTNLQIGQLGGVFHNLSVEDATGQATLEVIGSKRSWNDASRTVMMMSVTECDMFKRM